MSINHAQNLSSLVKEAGHPVAHSIRQASAKTGVDFSYLLQQAKTESSFQADIQAKTSSATGLFQFIDSTWMNMIKDHGHKYGLGQYANQINRDEHSTDAQLKQNILDLRKDPEIASLMAAELAQENKSIMESRLNTDKPIGSTDLYFAHFMGPTRAAAFLNQLQDTPDAQAAPLFGREAKANPAVFYDIKTGRARSLQDIYNHFDQKFSMTNPPSETNKATPTPVMTTSNYKGYSAVLSSLGPQQYFAVNTPQKTSTGIGLSQLLSNPMDILWLSQLDLPSASK